MNNPQQYSASIPATQKIILVSALLTISALVAGLLIASVLFPSSAGSTQAEQSTNQPETPLERKPIKLASSAELFSIPDKVAETASAPKRSETIVPRQNNKNLNPYVKVERSVIANRSKPTKQVTRQEKNLAALTDSLVTVLERLKQQDQKPGSGILADTTNDLRQVINQLVKQAVSKGKSEDYVRSLINDALAGRDAVPQALAKLDGKLDTRFLLASVLPKKPAVSIGGMNSDYMAALQQESQRLANPVYTKIAKTKKPRKARVRKAKLRKAKPRKAKSRYIVVRRGDNLSKISERAYGDPYGHEKIFQANKTLLANSHAIDIGQRLLIP